MSTAVFSIPSMDCPAEEAVIRSRLGKMPGVTGLSFDLFNRRLTVEHTLESEASITAALTDIGMPPTEGQRADANGSHNGHDHAGDGDPIHQPVATRLQVALLASSGVLAFASEVVAWVTKVEKSWPVITLAVVSILLGGLPTLRKGFIALRTLTLNINFLMTVAVIGAAAIVCYGTAPMKDNKPDTDALSKIQCPVLGLYAGNDARVTVVPAPAPVAVIALATGPCFARRRR